MVDGNVIKDIYQEKRMQELEMLIGEEWEKFFRMHDGNISKTINLLRMERRKCVNLSLDEFLDKYQRNKKLALEELLQEPVSQAVLSLTTGIDSSEIFNAVKKSPSTPAISLMKNVRLINKNDSLNKEENLWI